MNTDAVYRLSTYPTFFIQNISGGVTINSSLPAGSNSLGTVGIDIGANTIGFINQGIQSNNAYWSVSGQVSQVGTWNVGLSAGTASIGTVVQGIGNAAGSPWSVSGTITSNVGTGTRIISGGVVVGAPLPTGANTIGAVTQASGPWTVSGPTASGSAFITNPVFVAGADTGGIVRSLLTSTLGRLSVDVNTAPTTVVTQGTNPWVVQTPLGVSGTVTANAGTGNFIEVGPTASGSVVITNPVLHAGASTDNIVRTFLTDSAGRLAVNVNTFPALVAGTASIGSVVQGTGNAAGSPWSVSGTVTANQGTANTNANAWPVKSIFAGKATYSAATSGGVTQLVAVNTIQSLGWLWHPVSSALRYQLNKIIVSVPTGGSLTGVFALQVRNITAVGTGGTTGTIQAYDGANSASTASIVFGATASPTRATGISNEVIFNMASLSSPYIIDMSEMLEGKPLVMRANTAEGWEVSALVYTALSAAQRVGITFIWSEE